MSKPMTAISTVSLSERALCVDGNFSVWDPQVTDKRVGREVAERNNVTQKAGRYQKNLFPFSRPEYDALHDEIWAGVKYYHTRTVPWSYGERLLKASIFGEFNQAMKDRSAKVEKLLRIFVKVYPDYVLKAETALNGLFKIEDYPKASDVKQKFGITVLYSPVVAPGDFRLDLDESLLQELRAQHKVEFVDKQSEMSKKVWTRIHDAVSRAAKLSKSETKVYDSIFTDLSELADVLPSLNLLDDPEMDRMAQDLKQDLAGRDAITVRSSGDERAEVAKRANDLLKRMRPFISKA